MSSRPLVRFARTAGVAALLLASAPAAPAQPVSGDVTTTGFRAPTGSGFLAREGQWLPIRAELQVNGSDHFQGELRVERPDLDGDRVAYTERPVALTANQGLKPVHCYAVVNSADPSGAGNLDVVGPTGAVVNRRPLKPFDVLPNDTLFILDISERPIVKLADGLGGDQVVFGQDAPPLQPYYRPIMLGRMPFTELPDRWFGLESVNVIFWDEPDPSRLSIAQVEALNEWVRRGGQLVVGVGASWGRIRESALSEIMPLAGDEPTIIVNTLELFFQKFVSSSRTKREFDSPIAITAARPIRGRQILNDFLPDRRVLNLVVMDSVGSGRVTTIAACLRDLTSVGLRKAERRDEKAENPQTSSAYLFFQSLLDLTEFTPAFREAQVDGQMGMMDSPYLAYADLIRPIEFQETGGLLFFIALIFVVAYILTATLASWAWLRKKSATHLSWSLFAAFAVVGSVLSLAAVAVTRGFPRVNAVALVDLEAGSSDARAACFFGYRSPFRETVNLSLPGEDNYLRALTASRRDIGVYATPTRYRAIAGAAALEDTLLRSTLKQFEGFWSGPLDGTIRAKITLRREGDNLVIDPDSSIKNDLPIRFNRGYLLFLDPRLPDTPDRAAWQKRHHFRKNALLPPSFCVVAIELPALDPGAEVTQIGRAEFESLAGRMQNWRPGEDPENPREPRPDLPSLLEVQNRCVKWPMGGVFASRLIGDTEDAALLVSTRNLYLGCRSADQLDQLGVRFSTSGMVDRDISHWLVYGQAVLLLFSDDPGPARLHRNGQPLDSRSGKSVYRVRVPLTIE